MMLVAASKNLLRSINLWDGLKLLREAWILRRISREQSIETNALQFMRHCHAAQYLMGDENWTVFTHHWDAAQECLMQHLRLTYPWVDWEVEIAQKEKDELQKDIATWEDMFGSLDDEAVQEENERLVAWLLSDEPPLADGE